MKLFLIWLLGVPVVVISMVITQSLLQSQRVPKGRGLRDSSRVESVQNDVRSKKPILDTPLRELPAS